MLCGGGALVETGVEPNAEADVVPESDKQTSAAVVLTLFRRFGRYLVGYGCTIGKEYMDGRFRSGRGDRHQFPVQRRRESGSADFRHSTS